MSRNRDFLERLAMRLPIIQAPMAGGGDTPALVAAVCEAGGLGSIGAAYLSPGRIAETVQAVRALTDRPFAVNLFAPMPAPAGEIDIDRARNGVEPYYEELGLSPPAGLESAGESFDALFAAALVARPAVFSFTFGRLPATATAALKEQGTVVLGTATSVAEALALEADGVDAVVVQGGEAGGHRGTFATDFDSAMVGLIALLPQVVDAVDVPVIASGGIMDGRGIVAARALGAAAVQMGTAFLTCDEAGVVDAYKAAILGANETDTRLTSAFSGRPARGIANRFMDEVGAQPESILPFPYQNTLTRPLRQAAAKAGRPEFLSLWSGQGTRLARREKAADLMARLDSEMAATVEALRAD